MHIETDIYDDNDNFIYRRIISESGQALNITGLQEQTHYNVRSRKIDNNLVSEYSYSDFTTSAGIILEERIIYNSNKSGQWQSYSIKPDGTGEINITAIGDNNPSAHEDHYCTYNLNEDAFFFCRRSGGLLQIHKKDRLTGHVTKLTSDGSFDLRFPDVSPDGTMICANSNGNVTVVNSSTGALIASWTPTIALNSTLEFPRFNNLNNVLLSCSSFPSYFVEVRTFLGTLLSTIDSSIGAALARYNSDFTKIIYRTNLSGIDQVHTITSGGSSKTQITNNAGDKEFPAFSPDGLSFAFIQPAYTGNVYISTFASPNTKTNLTNNASSNEFNGYWGNVRVD